MVAAWEGVSLHLSQNLLARFECFVQSPSPIPWMNIDFNTSIPILENVSMFLTLTRIRTHWYRQSVISQAGTVRNAIIYAHLFDPNDFIAHTRMVQIGVGNSTYSCHSVVLTIFCSKYTGNDTYRQLAENTVRHIAGLVSTDSTYDWIMWHLLRPQATPLPGTLTDEMQYHSNEGRYFRTGRARFKSKNGKVRWRACRKCKPYFRAKRKRKPYGLMQTLELGLRLGQLF